MKLNKNVLVMTNFIVRSSYRYIQVSLYPALTVFAIISIASINSSDTQFSDHCSRLRPENMQYNTGIDFPIWLKPKPYTVYDGMSQIMQLRRNQDISLITISGNVLYFCIIKSFKFECTLDEITFWSIVKRSNQSFWSLLIISYITE